MPNLLSSWKNLKRQGYTRADRLYLLKVAGRHVSGSASVYCGWPEIPRVRSDRRRGRRSYTEYGERISAALASESWRDLIGVLEDLSERASRDTADKVLSRLPPSAREAVGVCFCCGGYHEREGGANDV